jgi:NAD(P)-dependent dehydrogenase (short-subunit alcohol dehydrogenase family)
VQERRKKTEEQHMGILEGRGAVVTGGGRGIGRGHCLHLAEQGAGVVVNDIAMAEELASAWQAIEADPEVVCVILGAGPKAFVEKRASRRKPCTG